MAGGSLKRRGGIIEGINVTPLVDITLVLLIIFMVTAKLVVTPAVPLDLPKASQSETLQAVFAVSILPDGGLKLDGASIEDTALGDRAAKALETDPELRAVIQADGSVPHRRVIDVLDTLKAAGMVRVAFGALPEAPLAGETAAQENEGNAEQQASPEPTAGEHAP